MRDQLVRGVRGHDDDGVLEVDVAAFAVAHHSLVEDLEEHVLHAGMRLFHLVEQDHRIGPPPHRLGQDAAFAIADIARRAAHQQADLMLLLELAHVDDGQVLLAAIEQIGQGQRGFGLAGAGHADHQKDADRLARIGQVGARGVDRLRDRFERVRLADDALLHRLFQMQYRADFVGLHAPGRDAGPALDDFGDRLRIDDRKDQRLLALERRAIARWRRPIFRGRRPCPRHFRDPR